MHSLLKPSKRRVVRAKLWLSLISLAELFSGGILLILVTLIASKTIPIKSAFYIWKPYLVYITFVFVTVIGANATCALIGVILKKRKCLAAFTLYNLFILFTVIFLLHFFIYVRYDNGLSLYIETHLRIMVDNYWYFADVKFAMDRIQKSFECCGSSSYDDYNAEYPLHTNPVPSSCCWNPNCSPNVKEQKIVNIPDNLYLVGCTRKLLIHFQKSLTIFGVFLALYFVCKSLELLFVLIIVAYDKDKRHRVQVGVTRTLANEVITS